MPSAAQTAAPRAGAPAGGEILFLGNSLTTTNDLPALVAFWRASRAGRDS